MTIRRVTQFLVLLACVAAAAIAPPVGAQAAIVKVVRSVQTVQPEDSPTGAAVDNPAAHDPIAHLQAAKNEFESFQIAVRNNGGAPLTNLDVSTNGSLRGPGAATIPSANITIYREAYTRVYTPSDSEGWEQYSPSYDANGFNTTFKCPASTGGDPLRCEFPDALIPKVDYFYGEPRNAFPIDVPSGQNRVAWVDVLVPQHQPIGTYTGTLKVTATGLSATIHIRLKVVNFEMPSTSSMQGGFDMNQGKQCIAHGPTVCTDTDSKFALNALYARAGLENRVSIVHPAYDDPTPANVDAFRRYVLPLLDGTSPVDPGGLLKPVRLPGARINDLFINQYQAAHAADWHAEAQSDSFLGRVQFYCDEVQDIPARWMNACNDPYTTANAAWGGGLPVTLTGDTETLSYGKANFPAVAQATDILAPLVNQMHPKGESNQRGSYGAFLSTPGHRLWMYQSCSSLGCAKASYPPPNDYTPHPLWIGWPSLGIDQPASQARALPWMIFDYKATGDYYFETVQRLAGAWTDCSVAPTNCIYSEGGNGDGTLFYPGIAGTQPRNGIPPIGGTHDIPIESIRLKRYRDGMEDYEYLRYLAFDLGKANQARNIAGGPYASLNPKTGKRRGLFKRVFSSTVSQQAIDDARAALIALLPPAGSRPQTRITSAPPSRTHDRTPALSFTSSRARSSFRCKLDDRNFYWCKSPKTLSKQTYGQHIFRVFALDSAGRPDPTPAKRSFKVIR